MDLKVSIEGVLREVCGVTDTTTCEEIIFKLAQAASLPGFYTLVAKHHNKEETLSPDERIVNFLRTLKEKPTNVKFILRRLEAPSPRPAHGQSHQTTILHRSGDRYTTGSLGIEASKSNQPMESRTVSANWNMARGHSIIASPPKHILHRTVNPSASSGDLIQTRPKKFESEADEYHQLEDQLAYQEREVELNRIYLLQLDKEITELEQNMRFTSGHDSGLIVGPATELAQLTAAPWPQLLEANRARQRDLIVEKERHQLAMERVSDQLDKAREEANQLETRVAQELGKLLMGLEAANANRRQQLRSLSPQAVYSRPSTASSTDGVAI